MAPLTMKFVSFLWVTFAFPGPNPDPYTVSKWIRIRATEMYNWGPSFNLKKFQKDK
jgi:hypothetical protein